MRERVKSKKYRHVKIGTEKESRKKIDIEKVSKNEENLEV